MTLLVPSAPAGAHAPQSGGEGISARRDTGDADFGVALAEVAGKGGREPGGKGGAAKAKDAAGAALRATQRVDAPDPAAPDDAAATDMRAELLAAVDANHRLKTGQRSERASHIGDEKPADAGNAVVPPGAVTAEPPPATAALDALIALGANLSPKSDQIPSADELQAAIGGRIVGGQRPGAGRADKVEAGEAAPLAGPDIEEQDPVAILPVRVVREEKHFQPVGRAAQRVHEMTDAALDDRRMPATPATLPRMAEQGAAQREPTSTAARGAEAVAQVSGPIATNQEPMPGSVGVQIADRVQQALGAPSEAESSPSQPLPSAHDPNAKPAFAPAIRTIKLQLNPVSLGAVTIMLTGGDDALRIHLEAELAEAVGQVEQDRGALSARLNGAGYAITELTVARLGGQAAETDFRDSGARNSAQQGDGAGGSPRDGGASFAGERDGRRPGERQSFAETPASGRSSPRGVAVEHVVSGISYAGRFRPV